MNKTELLSLVALVNRESLMLQASLYPERAVFRPNPRNIAILESELQRRGVLRSPDADGDWLENWEVDQRWTIQGKSASA